MFARNFCCIKIFPLCIEGNFITTRFILHLDACVWQNDKSDFTLTLHNLLHIDLYKSNCQDYCQSFACNLRVRNLATTVVWHNFLSFLKYSRCLTEDSQSSSAWHAWVIQYYIYHISYMVHIISSTYLAKRILGWLEWLT